MRFFTYFRNGSSRVNMSVRLVFQQADSFYDVPHGAETHPTLYWRRRQADPFHIDYCFIPDVWLQDIVQVTVGEFAAWHKYSDHRPLLVELGDMTHE